MKVGILTFPNSVSHGATLQMYALYRTVQEICGDVEIINYYNEYMKNERHGKEDGSDFSIKKKIRLMARKLLHNRQFEKFHRFEQEKMHLYPEKSFGNRSDLSKLSSRYGCVICGSDQVWNPEITDFDMTYFLDFCGKYTRRVSYAPSFGIETFPEQFSYEVGELLKRFSNLSIREMEGQHYIEKLIGRKAEIVLDPTLLLSVAEWKQEETAVQQAKEEYVLYYTIRQSDRLFRFCRQLAEESNCKILIVGGNIVTQIRNKDKSIEYVSEVGPSEWLNLIHHSRYVVTNSFHGTVFSIIYRKNFFVEFSSLSNSRLVNIIRMFGLEERVLGNKCLAKLMPVDYTQTELVLPAMKKSSMDFLINAVRVGDTE